MPIPESDCLCWLGPFGTFFRRAAALLGISKGGSRVLRFLLVEAAHTAIRKDADLRQFYQRLAERHGRPKAKVAVSRKLLIRAYIMLRDEIVVRNSNGVPSQLGLPAMPLGINAR